MAGIYEILHEEAYWIDPNVFRPGKVGFWAFEIPLNWAFQRLKDYEKGVLIVLNILFSCYQ